MSIRVAYFDESGDDGVLLSSSKYFILTSLYMDDEKWKENFTIIKRCREELKACYGFHLTEEFHTQHFIANKKPYGSYNWSRQQKQEILLKYAEHIADLDAKSISVIIDKTQFKDGNYKVLENAL